MADGTDRAKRVVDLKSTTVPKLLADLLAERFSGELTVEGPAIETHVAGFAGGMPRWCEANIPASRLGTLLVKANALTPENLEAFLKRGPDAQGRRLGDRLLAEQIVEKSSLHGALREQCELRLLDLCGLDRGKAAVVAGATVKHAAYPIGRLYLVLRRGIEKHFDEARVDAELGDLPKQLIVSTRLLRRRRKEFSFSKEESAAVDELFALDGISFKEWLSASPLDQEASKRLLYLLFVCSLVENAGPVTSTPRRPTSERMAVSVRVVDLTAPETMPKESDELARFLTGKVDENESPFASLGLEPGADLEMIDAAGAAIQGRLDVAASEGSGTLRCEVAARCVDKLVLRARVLREEKCEAEGKKAFAAEQWPEALTLYEDLLELRKGDVPTRITLTWIRYQMSEQAPEDALRAADRLDFLGGSANAPAEAHRYRGKLLSELGEDAAAAKAFERAVELDPEDDASVQSANQIRSRLIYESAKDDRDKGARPGPTVQEGRPLLLSGPWPLVWTVAGIALVGFVAAQVILRLGF